MCDQPSGATCASRSSGALMPPERRCCTARHVQRVPIDDGGDHEIEPRCAKALVLEGPVGQPPLAMDINGVGEKVMRFSLVQSSMAAAAQFRVLQPVECEQRPLDAADFRQREVDPVLAAVGREFLQNQRRRNRAGPQ